MILVMKQRVKLIEVLRGHQQLLALHRNSNDIGKQGCTALGSFLSNPACKLKEIYLHDSNINDDCCKILRDSLTVNKSVRKMSFGGRQITAEGWRLFSAHANNPSNTLEGLHHVLSCIQDKALTELCHSFKNKEKLKVILVTEKTIIKSARWDALFTCLQSLPALCS